MGAAVTENAEFSTQQLRHKSHTPYGKEKYLALFVSFSMGSSQNITSIKKKGGGRGKLKTRPVAFGAALWER